MKSSSVLVAMGQKKFGANILYLYIQVELANLNKTGTLQFKWYRKKTYSFLQFYLIENEICFIRKSLMY